MKSPQGTSLGTLPGSLVPLFPQYPWEIPEPRTSTGTILLQSKQEAGVQHTDQSPTQTLNLKVTAHLTAASEPWVWAAWWSQSHSTPLWHKPALLFSFILIIGGFYLHVCLARCRKQTQQHSDVLHALWPCRNPLHAATIWGSHLFPLTCRHFQKASEGSHST